MHVGGREPRLPIMRVHDVGHEVRHIAKPDVGGHARQRRKAQAVVRPVRAIGHHVGIAGTAEQMRRVEHQQIELAATGFQQPRDAAEEQRPFQQRLGALQRVHHGGIAGNERAHLDAFGAQGQRQRAGDVGEASRLDDGIDFGGDREDAHRLTHSICRSSAG